MVGKIRMLTLSAMLIALATLGPLAQGKSEGRREEAAQWLRQGDAAFSQGNYKEALNRYKESLRIFEQISDKKGLADGASSLGRLYSGMGQYEKALELLQEALKRHEELKDKAGSGWDLTRIAAVEMYRGRYSRALEVAEQALNIHEAVGHSKGIAETLRTIGDAHRNLGEHKRGLTYGERSLRIAEEIGDSGEIGATLNSIGLAHQELGNYAQALEYYQKSLTIREEIGDQKGLAAAFNNIGLVNRELGDYVQAMSYHQKSLKIKQAIGDKRGVGTSSHNIGEVLMSLGRYAEALEHYQKALRIFEEIGAKREWAQGLSTLGIVYKKLGNHVQALEYYEKSLKIREEIRDKNGTAQSLHGIANIYAHLGDYSRALKYHEKALRLKEEIGNQRIVSISLHDIGSLHASLGHYDQALEYYQKSLKVREEIGDKSGVVQILSSMGSAYYKRKEMREADEHLSEAIKLSKQIGRKEVLSASLHQRGLVLRDTGRVEEALRSMKEAAEVIDQVRSQISLAEQKAGFLQEKLEVYEDLIGLSAKLNHAEDAFHYAERAKARAFLDLLTEARAEIRKKIRPELRERERMTLAKLWHRQRALQAEAAKKNRDEKTMEELTEQLKVADQEYEDLKLEIRRASPEYAAIRYPDPIRLSQAMELLDERTVMLEYVLGREGSFLLAITKTDFRVYPLPKREELEQKAEALVRLLGQMPTESSTLTYVRAAYNLYEILVKPAEKQLAGKRSMILVPDGALALVPFQALVTDKVELTGEVSVKGLPYLVKSYDISYIQSASVLEWIKQTERRGPWARKFIGFAPIHFTEDIQIAEVGTEITSKIKAGLDAIYRGGVGLGNLPYTRKELEWIKELFNDQETMLYLEQNATEERVKKEELKSYRYVHFATHGIIHPDRPEFSSILLKSGGREDGYLQVAEIINLELNADLVVLSACQSGKGKQIRGEGLIGLTRGFMYAGAASVLASLWSVQDRPTAHLMRAFYKNLLRGTKSEALRLAQLEFIKGESKDLEYYSHPYYWSAFVLMGAR